MRPPAPAFPPLLCAVDASPVAQCAGREPGTAGRRRSPVDDRRGGVGGDRARRPAPAPTAPPRRALQCHDRARGHPRRPAASDGARSGGGVRPARSPVPLPDGAEHADGRAAAPPHSRRRDPGHRRRGRRARRARRHGRRGPGVRRRVVASAAVDFTRTGYEVGWNAEEAAAVVHASHPLGSTWAFSEDDGEMAAQWRALEHPASDSLGRKVWELYQARGFAFPGTPGSAPPMLTQHDGSRAGRLRHHGRG